MCINQLATLFNSASVVTDVYRARYIVDISHAINLYRGIPRTDDREPNGDLSLFTPIGI